MLGRIQKESQIDMQIEQKEKQIDIIQERSQNRYEYL